MKRKVIAITGGIGSGKSTVAQIVAGYGFEVIDCDNLSREVASSPQLLAEVKLLDSRFVKDGQLDRRLIREEIFGNDALYDKYCQLFWTEIATLLQQRIEGKQVVFVEIALPDAFPFDWTEVWCVQSDNNTRVQRVVARDGVSHQNVLEIISKQKELPATRTICNNGTVEKLAENVAYALQKAGLI